MSFNKVVLNFNYSVNFVIASLVISSFSSFRMNYTLEMLAITEHDFNSKLDLLLQNLHKKKRENEKKKTKKNTEKNQKKSLSIFVRRRSSFMVLIIITTTPSQSSTFHSNSTFFIIIIFIFISNIKYNTIISQFLHSH